MSTYLVLVFGSSGVGKTSLCNTLTGQHRNVGNAAIGTTFATYTYQPFSINDDTFYITDTVGLNEGEGGTVSAEQAASDLINLFLEATDGFSILIHVFKGRRDTAHDKNYDFFVKGLTNERIPTLLVATGCEDVLPKMSAWANDNKKHFKKGCKYEEVIATCFRKGERPELENVYAPLRIESRQQLLAAIKQHALLEPKTIWSGGGISIIFEFLKKLWNRFIELSELPEDWGLKEFRAVFNKSMYDTLIKRGFSSADARALTSGIIMNPFVDIAINIILKKIAEPITTLKDIGGLLKK